MDKLSVEQIIQKIKNEECFEAVSSDYSFTIKIEEYTPYVCAAVHDGHQFRKELWQNCLHTEYERWYEEDPCTKEMIADFFTKPLQGALFRKFRAFIMNLPYESVDQLQEAQECVEAAGMADGTAVKECFSAAGKRTYAEVAQMRKLESSTN